MAEKLKRREFLQGVSMAVGLSALGGVWAEGQPRVSRSPNEKLNIACIGAGGQGASDIGNVSSENLVAFADVDEQRAAASYARYPEAKQFTDYRKMFDSMHKEFDAVVVSTPDHHHAFATSLALKHGKHVYCQKPLTHTVWEARQIAQLAAKTKVATQMGTQGHSFDQYAKLVEIIRGGAIGDVTEVHVWTDRPAGWWPQGINKPSDSKPAPKTLDWDMWLGPTMPREYSPAYLPFVWRGWWDFGTGAIGDMACHLMDPVFWALELGAPIAVEGSGEGMTADSPPTSSTITYEFGKRGNRPPVKMIWYDGVRRPSKELFGTDKLAKNDNGSLWIGTKGKLVVEHSKDPILLPMEQYSDYKAPAPSLTRSPGHHKQWIDAAKTGSPTGSNFQFAANLTEAALLGNVALRVGKRIQWDSKRLRVTNVPEANQYIRREYRKGWSL